MFVEIVYHAQITRRKKRRVDIRLFYVIIALYPIRYRVLVKFLNDAVHFCLPSRFHLFLDRKIFRHWSYLSSLECKSYYSLCKDIRGLFSVICASDIWKERNLSQSRKSFCKGTQLVWKIVGSASVSRLPGQVFAVKGLPRVSLILATTTLLTAL